MSNNDQLTPTNHQSIDLPPHHPASLQNGASFFNYEQILQSQNNAQQHAAALHNSLATNHSTNSLPTSLPNLTNQSSNQVNSIAACAAAAAQIALNNQLNNQLNNAGLPLNPSNTNNGLPNLPALSSLNYQALLQNRLLAAGFPPMFPSPNNLNTSNLNASLQQQQSALQQPTTGIGTNLPVDSAASINSATQNSNELNQNGSLLATLQSLYAAQSKVPISLPTTTNSVSSPTVTKSTNFSNYHKEVNSMNNLNNLYRRQMENKMMKSEHSLNHLDNSEELKPNRRSPVKEESVNVEDLNDNCNNVNSKEIVPTTTELNLNDNSTTTNIRSSPPVNKSEENGENGHKVNESQEHSSRPSSNCSTSSNI